MFLFLQLFWRIITLVQSTFSTITVHYGEMTVKTLSNFTVISKSGEFTVIHRHYSNGQPARPIPLESFVFSFARQIIVT